MNIVRVPSINETKALDTKGLRDNFLIQDLFESGVIALNYTDIDRAVVGSACPLESPLKLEVADELRAAYFCERRELGILNLGGAGSVSVDGETYALENLECLYVGRGSKEIVFESDPGQRALFYLVSYPAHATYPTVKKVKSEANRLELGAQATANERTIFQYIFEEGIQSCQLVMGFTTLAEGSVWNTMPPHTHDRRSEVYLYFDLEPDQMVVHLMGEPQETRHLTLRDKQAVLSPSWSIHAGCGTGAYSFVWAMGGENQRFDDMDPAPVSELL